jgi:hemoglobin
MGNPPPVPPTPAPETMPAGPALFTRLGGLDAIRAVVDDFSARLAADAEVAAMLRGVDVDQLKRLLVEQICEATGGPCAYTGRSMREAHRGLSITPAQWDRTVGYLRASLDRFNVPAREQEELLTLVGSMRGDIVGQ